MIRPLQCLGCQGGTVLSLVDFGRQPPSNRFLRPDETTEDSHPLHIGQCDACGLVQLIDAMPANMVKSRYPWLSYNEPEGHLDRLVERLVRLPGITEASRMHGLTYKDDSTLARLNRLNYLRTFRFDVRADLGIDCGLAGLETIQSAMTEDLANQLVNRHGRADILIARHILEHAHDPVRFLGALAQLVTPTGYLVFEIPDCTKFMGACDYSFVWEEHICYFSPITFRNFITANRFRLFEMMNFDYSLEDSLVAVVQCPAAESDQTPSLVCGAAEADIQRARKFAERFDNISTSYGDYFASVRSAGKRVGIFGAGHLAVKFVNLFELEDYIDCVIDDNPNKQGLLMPGSMLPIVSSAALAEWNIDLCMLALSPESEQKVLSKQKEYIDRGGEFRSIFARSSMALPVGSSQFV